MSIVVVLPDKRTAVDPVDPAVSVNADKPDPSCVSCSVTPLASNFVISTVSENSRIK
jgi:hypothetical protein